MSASGPIRSQRARKETKRFDPMAKITHSRRKPFRKAEDGEAVYCLCREPYNTRRPMIMCDSCNEWYHMTCVGLKMEAADDIEKYECEPCQIKRDGGRSYYRQIDGIKYDRKMLEVADKAVAGVGDGRISVKDAKLVAHEAFDGNVYTTTEKTTMSYIRENYKLTAAATKWLDKVIALFEGESGNEDDEDSPLEDEFVASDDEGTANLLQ